MVMTQYQFLSKAREIHGYKYIYPGLASEVSPNSKINVLYKGVIYSQTAAKHLIGRCPEKNTPTKTTDEFVAEAKARWGDRYDYSLVDYKGALEKVKILYEGVVYEQTPSAHLVSMPEFRMNSESFVRRAKAKWGDKYDYTLVVYKNCNTKVKILHKETGVVYEQTPASHLKSAPEARSVALGTSHFIKASIKIHNAKYDYSLTEYESLSKKVTIVCPKHGKFVQRPASHLKGMGCRQCGIEKQGKKRKSKYDQQSFLKAATEKWGNKYDYSRVKYVNALTKVEIIHDGIIYPQTPLGHLKHPPENFLDQEIFLIKARRKWGDKYDYSLVNFVSCAKRVKIIHNGAIYEQLPNNHLKYAPERRNIRTHEEFVTDASRVHNNKYSYERAVYVKDNRIITITCPLHGDFEQKAGVHLRGSGCRRCSESIGERRVAKVLDEMGLQYKREHIFEDCRNVFYLKYDFYIPSLRTCIEFDGIQHFEPIEFFGGVQSFEKLKQNDALKRTYCEENFIDLVRIRYDRIERIPDILWDALKYKLVMVGQQT